MAAVELKGQPRQYGQEKVDDFVGEEDGTADGDDLPGGYLEYHAMRRSVSPRDPRMW